MKITKKGFTLIELMIVIAIIGILAGMALPRFSKAREQAKMKTCWGNSKNLESALELFKMDDCEFDDDYTDLDALSEYLANYLSGKQYPECPTKGGHYAYDEEKGVFCDIHGNASHPPQATK